MQSSSAQVVAAASILNYQQAANATTRSAVRAFAKLHERLGSYDDIMIVLSVFSRSPEGLGETVSRAIAGRCNVSAISRATGIPRETVRRRTKHLTATGVLVPEGRNFAVSTGWSENLRLFSQTIRNRFESAAA